MAEKLAIDGGTAVLTRKDYGNWPVITDDDRRFINEVLDSGIVAAGTAPQVSALEKEWAEFVGIKHCLTTCSGTAALHMALAALGVGPGDEVITSAYTFLASASCAIHQNAIPVFVDIDPKTLCMDPAKLEAAITERTKVITHGAMYKGKMVSTIGDIGTFSLNNFKNLCGGEGGLFVTNDEDLKNKGALIRCFGDEIDEVSQRRKYNASILGYMYRNQELPAALARGQLKHLDELNDTRIANAEYLTAEFARIPGLIPPYCPPDCKHVFWFYNLRFDPAAAGVDCNPRRFRIAMEKALYKEGMMVGQWQEMALPAQDLFQSKLGYGGSSHPWAINEARGIKYNYDVAQFPEAVKLCDTYTIVHGIQPPNGIELMKKTVEAFQKVFADLDTVMAHADDEIYPGPDGSSYGAA